LASVKSSAQNAGAAEVEPVDRAGHYGGNSVFRDTSMAKIAIVPPELRAAADQLNMSPAIVSGGHVFLTGATGGDVHGQLPGNPEAQFRNAFEKIGFILRAGGLSFRSVVEMTTYHVGLRDHFDLFDAIRLEYLAEPYPAWTAVEVAGLRREGAIVEIRIIASTDPDN
jgi:enamine deaminase RidA (YjgF/YER057c/UK114 family)